VIRQLVVILGDQLDPEAAVFDDFDPKRDLVWMSEVYDECTKVWCHKARITIFLSAMRHFAAYLRSRGIKVDYHELAPGTLAGGLLTSIDKWKPARVIATEPGEWGVRESLRVAVPKVQFLPDRHFFCSHEEFRLWASGKKQLRMEFFYRAMRERYGYLMESGQPAGGQWNFDSENRKSFGRSGPPGGYLARSFPPDAITNTVIHLVEQHFPDHPGKLESFDYPVTREDARAALSHFITSALPSFGDYQDAMWTGEPVLFHSRLSAALNLKILDPREVVAAAEKAYQDGAVPLAAAEGFIRQILGWREYVRGIYWLYMPEYLERNHLNAEADLPPFYWTGETDMVCLRESIGQTLETGYAHHIQRLMVTGLFALLVGVRPQAVHEWYLAVYVDAVEWVELPNTLGMSQYGDGGVMASKPYIASGKYIDRMSNYCGGCPYDPAQSVGSEACPFTTLYWDFLVRNKQLLSRNPRMSMQLKNLARLKPEQIGLIQIQAAQLRQKFVPKEILV
jgi:deoxyribodipyrimidine photolyase-related protein